MQFVFIKNTLPEILAKPEVIECPSQFIKKFGPYLIASLFNPTLNESKQVLQYFDKNIDKSRFLSSVKPDGQVKNWKFNNKKCLEGLACSIIVSNQNLINKDFHQYILQDYIMLSDALPLAYTLVIQNLRKWQIHNQKEVISKITHLINAQKQEPKITINTLYQKQFLSDLGLFYPEFLHFSQGRIYATELPIDYFIGELNYEYQDFFIQDNQLIDLKVKDQVYAFQFLEEFEQNPIKAFLWRYTKLFRLQQLYPNAKVIWCNKSVEKKELLNLIQQ